MVSPVVTVRCNNGHEREIRPGDVAPGDFPVCQEPGCYRPMFATKVRGE